MAGTKLLCLVTQLCLTLCEPMDCSPPGSPLFTESLQAGILEGVAMPSSRGSSQLKDRTQPSYLADGFFTTEPSSKPYSCIRKLI